MSANQTQIPAVKHDDDAINQIQQNVNKVFRNLNNQITENQTSISHMNILGEIKFASLTLAQFQMIAGPDWILANGQSSVGTAYAQLSGNLNVPTVTLAGTTAFIKVN